MVENAKRVLLVSYNYPPMREAQSVRWAFLSKWLRSLGWDIEVLTVALPNYYDYLLEEVPEDLNVYRVYPGPFQDIFFRLKARARVEDTGFKDIRTKPAVKLARSAYRFLRTLANTVLVPDLRTEWLPFAQRVGKYLAKVKKYDLIISSHEPGVSHLVAHRIKKAYNIPWVADFGDPWISQSTPPWRKSLDRYVEKQFINDINGFIFTNDKTAEMYKHLYPSISQKQVITIPQGYDPDTVERVKPLRLPQDTLNIVYTGTFYKGLREPYETLHAIKKLSEKCKIHLYLAGNIFDEYLDFVRLNGMSHFTTYMGYLDYEATISLQKGASLLLYIGNANRYQTPGKIYEYLGARRPVLVIQNDSEDVASRIVMETNRGVVAPNNRAEIAGRLLSLYELWMANGLDSEFNLSCLENYSFKAHAQVIIREFDAILPTAQNYAVTANV